MTDSNEKHDEKKVEKKDEFGIVIILNGPSCVGKTSIVRAFQASSAKPWLSIGIDNFFCGVLPQKFCLEDKPEHHSVMRGVRSCDGEGKRVFSLEIGKDGEKVIKGMHRAIAAYSRTGNNVIVDYIQYNKAWVNDLNMSLIGLKVFFVQVTASLEIIESREDKRGTSPRGHCRSHYFTVDEGMEYNFSLDTEKCTADQSAKLLSDFIVKNM